MTVPACLPNAFLCLAILSAACPPRVLAETPTLRPENAPSARQNEPIAFDIRAQQLAGAIEIYGTVTGLQVIYDASLAEGQSSAEIRGAFTAEVALQALLRGTGLMALRTGPDALVIVPVPPQARAANPAIGEIALKGTNASQQRYYALIQAGIRNTFCLNSETRSASYRVAVNLWIDPSGAVEHFRVLGSTGRTSLDQTIEDAMRRVTIGEPPPVGIAQPFTVVILPAPSGAGIGCR
jgi:TonB family protein